MTHGSLFSGIGGFDLAAQWMGWKNIFHCEINPFCQKILNHYWPNADSYTDIKQTDFSIYRGKIDVLSGGFPCQPFSLAGQRKGAEDDRYLWPEMLRAIGEIRPRWVIGENVAGLVSMVQPEVVENDLESQTNLQGEVDSKTVQEYQQYVIETVCRDLEHLGYSVQPIIIPACAVGAPHRRDRIWFIAHRNDKKCDRGTGESQQEWPKAELRGNGVLSATTRSSVQQPFTNASGDRWIGKRAGPKNEDRKPESGFSGFMEGGLEGLCIQEHATDPNQQGLQIERLAVGPQPSGREKSDRLVEQYSCNDWRALPTERWENFPTQPPVCGGDDGLPTRLDGITFPKWRSESIKAYGNAVVPQVVLEIFKGIKEIYNEHKH